MEYQLDMSMMFAMHDALRRELVQVARIASRTDDNPGQLLRAALGWELFKKFLVVHHQSEDDVLWPTLRTNVAGQPDRVALADALEAEHAVIEPLLTAIDAAAADPDYGYQRFGDIVDELATKLAAHLSHEETDGLALLVIATAQLMLVLDDTIVNVALPSMQRSLHLATSHLNWVISFYALAFGGLLLAGGRAGDLFGRLRVFRVGVGVFTLASVVGGFAPNGPVLIASRVVQGAGAAIAAPCALSLLATTFPAGPARTRALGVYGAMAGLGSVVGLLLGGVLTEYLSWRWVLFINVPIAVLVLIGTGVLVPGDTERGTLDVPGAVTATLGIGLLIFALTRGNTNGWNDAGTLASFAAGAVLLAVFVLIERFSRAPMVPPPVVRDRNRGGANAVMLLLGAGMLAMFYLLTLYMQVVRGYSATRAGLAYLPFVAGVGRAS